MNKDPETNIGCAPWLVIILLIIVMASCSIHRRISREWKNSPGQERLNLLDSYYRVKENWDNGYAKNREEMDSIVVLIKNIKK